MWLAHHFWSTQSIDRGLEHCNSRGAIEVRKLYDSYSLGCNESSQWSGYTLLGKGVMRKHLREYPLILGAFLCTFRPLTQGRVHLVDIWTRQASLGICPFSQENLLLSRSIDCWWLPDGFPLNPNWWSKYWRCWAVCWWNGCYSYTVRSLGVVDGGNLLPVRPETNLMSNYTKYITSLLSIIMTLWHARSNTITIGTSYMNPVNLHHDSVGLYVYTFLFFMT